MCQVGVGLLLYVCDCFKCVVNETFTNNDFDEFLWYKQWLNIKVNLLKLELFFICQIVHKLKMIIL